MIRTYIIEHRGRTHTWALLIHRTEEAAADMRADGIELHEVANTVPLWAANLGLARLWCFTQDVWTWPGNWRRK